MVQQRLRLGFAEAAQVHVHARSGAARTFEGGERPGIVAQERRCRAQVCNQRTAHAFADFRLVLAKERVEHERCVPLSGMTRLAPSLAIGCDLFRHLLDRLPEQMRQHEGPRSPGLDECRDVSGRGDPAGKLGLNGPGICKHFDIAAEGPGEAAALAPPERTHVLHAGLERCCPIRKRRRIEHEIVRLPARCEGYSDPALRQIVDQRPLLRDPHGVVERTHHAARANGDPRSDGRDRRRGHRGIGVRPAEIVEMPLRRPHGLKTMLIGKMCAFQQQPISIGRIAPAGTGEIEQTETDMARGSRGSQIAAHLPLRSQDDMAAFRQRPEQFERRDIETQAGHCQPGALGLQMSVHPGEKVAQVAVLDHHALRPSRGTGRVDHVGKVGTAGTTVERIAGERGSCVAQVFQRKNPCFGFRQRRRRTGFANDQGHARIGDHVRDPVLRICRIQRHVTAPGLVYRDEAGKHLRRSGQVQTYQRFLADALRDQ